MKTHSPQLGDAAQQATFAKTTTKGAPILGTSSDLLSRTFSTGNQAMLRLLSTPQLRRKLQISMCAPSNQSRLRLYRKELPDEATPEQEPTPQTPAAKKALTGTDSNGRGYVVYENEIRVGGTRPWRNNNPGNFDKPDDHPKNIGTDGRFLIFPDPATGKQELIDNVKAHSASTIRSFITVHAPPSENDTEKYIREVLQYMNNGSAIGECDIKKPTRLFNDGTALSSMTDSEQSSFAMAVAREEGWCDVTQKKATYNCKSASIPDEYKGKLACP